MVRNNIFDVIIVGAGSMGMATGYFLAKRGVKTLLIDSFDPPHHNGSHHGSTRIIRHAYGEGSQYVPLLLRAQVLWEQLEKESNTTLFEKTGVLGIGPRDSAFINETIESANTHGLPLNVMSSTEMMEKWTGLDVPNHFVGCYEPLSGILYSEKCIEVYRELALNYNASYLPHTNVVDIQGEEDRVSIKTNSGDYYAKKVIVTAGAWTSKLLHSLELPLQPTRKTFAWFETKTDEYTMTNFPAFFFDAEEGKYYGFPNMNGDGLKIGRHDGGKKINPDDEKEPFGIDPADEGDVRQFLNVYMPNASGAIKDGKVCMYTLTPDEHFIVDHHPLDENIIIAAGFSGHGFKFSSVMGEVLSQLAIDGETEHDISLFRLSRFIH
ncbi:N-methyl-L-tryptophan oxidase [Sutcliffiella cohnii]|uniref:N-methyl-L-tryptophan oxidase n=1 Tax=Sutcliffiella cohnii TaxID=33932 RepID=UPI002E1B00A5|nr:N-methyl-L-tryptophan oxidase [Sutcliffiella cohnii]MED4015663.1 N-methyl-L-tryptophan oxidase [Sutcliffiella cohnii]